jgi:hypothetical protein
MEKILVHTRGGLGDQIICNGMINYWNESKFIYLAARSSSIPTLECMYKDNPNIEIIPTFSIYLGNDHEVEIAQLAKKLNVESIGVSTLDIALHRYQDAMYECVDVPIEYRYSKFRLPNEIPKRKELYDKFKPNKKYALISNLGSSGFNEINWDQHIDPNLDILFLEPVTDNLLDWIDLIMEAEEIHCIPSGPFHFIDSIWPLVKGQKFFHNSRSGTNFNPNNEHNQHCWEVIKYDKKTSA